MTFYSASSTSSLPLTSRRRVLGYHEFSLSRSKDVYQITPEIFKTQIATVLMAAERTGAELVISFDDAHRSQVKLAAPVLDDNGLRGIFFTPAVWVNTLRESATWTDLRGLADRGHQIGSHGNNHVLLTQCSPNTLREELVQSRQTLEDHLGRSVQAISMPGGRWNKEVAAACQAAGYRELYTSAPEGAWTKTVALIRTSPVIVGRLIVRRTMPASILAGYIAEDWATLAKLRLEYNAKQLLKRALGDAEYQAIWRSVLRSPIEGS